MKKYLWPVAVGILAIIIIALLFIQTKQSNNLNLQSQCLAQAKTVFDDYEKGVENYSYNNHYDSKLGKCYVLIQGSGADGETDELFDAYENKAVASCLSYSAAPENNGCSYLGSNKKYNLDEFNSFIQPFMNN